MITLSYPRILSVQPVLFGDTPKKASESSNSNETSDRFEREEDNLLLEGRPVTPPWEQRERALALRQAAIDRVGIQPESDLDTFSRPEGVSEGEFRNARAWEVERREEHRRRYFQMVGSPRELAADFVPLELQTALAEVALYRSQRRVDSIVRSLQVWAPNRSYVIDLDPHHYTWSVGMHEQPRIRVDGHTNLEKLARFLRRSPNPRLQMLRERELERRISIQSAENRPTFSEPLPDGVRERLNHAAVCLDTREQNAISILLLGLFPQKRLAVVFNPENYTWDILPLSAQHRS